MASVIQNNFRVEKITRRSPRSLTSQTSLISKSSPTRSSCRKDITADQREEVGLQGVFRSVFPIKDFSETSSLEFVSYHLDKPKYDVDECRQRGMTYAAPIKVVIRLVVWDTNEETGHQSIRDVKEQEVYFGEIPLMTDNGTFIINGTERVVVSQLHRSPGVFYDHDKGKTHPRASCCTTPASFPIADRGSTSGFDPKDILYVRIDRRRKLHATVLLRALGFSTEELLNYFYATESVFLDTAEKRYTKSVEYDLLPGQRATRDIRHPNGNEILVKKNRKFTRAAIRKLQESGIDRLPIEASGWLARWLRTTSSTTRRAKFSCSATRS